LYKILDRDWVQFSACERGLVFEIEDILGRGESIK